MSTTWNFDAIRPRILPGAGVTACVTPRCEIATNAGLQTPQPRHPMLCASAVRAVICAAMVSACLLFAGCQETSSGVYDNLTPMVTPSQITPWATPMGKGQEIRSRHYDIFTTATREQTRDCLPGFMEACYANYLLMTGLTDQGATDRMVVYMMGSRGEWAGLTAASLGETAQVFLNIEAGGYCYDKICVFWDMGGQGTFSIASHEGLHQFFAYRLKQHIPASLEEGLCTTAEGYEIVGRSVRFTPERNLNRFTVLRGQMVAHRWIPLEKLLSMDAGDVTNEVTERAVEYYGQLWALARFLQTHPVYGAGLRRMLQDAQAGNLHEGLKLPLAAVANLGGRDYNRKLSEPLFRAYISNDFPMFEKEYREFARKLAKL